MKASFERDKRHVQEKGLVEASGKPEERLEHG